jgi:type II secretory pathway component PulC
MITKERIKTAFPFRWGLQPDLTQVEPAPRIDFFKVSIGLLYAFSAVCLIYTGARISRTEDFKVKELETEIAAMPQTASAISWPQIQPYGNYADVIGKRDIFQPYVPPVARAVVGTAVPQDIAKATEWLKSLTLVGIMFAPEPQAVIEDTRKRETLFLKSNDEVGEAVVEEIMTDKVIFNYSGHRMELTK